MIVICLEGPHGCGKTELVKEFSNAGLPVLDEAFIDMPTYEARLHPQSLLMEMNWVNSWFQRILQVASVGDKNVIIVDRSPLSAVFYTRNKKGSLLAPLIAAQVEELREVNIEIFVVHVKCDFNVLWNRVKRRLEIEPERALYKEDSIAWLNEVKSFYDSFPGWDFTVDNNVDDLKMLKKVMNEIIEGVRNKNPSLAEIRRVLLSLNENRNNKILRLDNNSTIAVRE